MKKILTLIIGMAAGTVLVHAQGFMSFTAGASAITTNTATFNINGGESGGVGGVTYKTAGGYDYALLVSTTAITDGPTDPNWVIPEVQSSSAPVTAVNNTLTAGGETGPSAGQFQSNLPVGFYYAEVVGWSSNEGSSWTTVETELVNNSWTAPGYFGFVYSGTASLGTAASSPGDAVFPTAIPNGSLVLYAVPTPEPTTLALAGLGGLSMLFLRRRKS